MDEIWKDVIGYSGIYIVSNRGRVKRVATGGSAVVGRILKHDCSRHYPRVVLSWQGIIKKRSVHLIVLDAFVGLRPPGLEACHNDGNKLNPHAENLRWDTQSANSFDCVRHGTHVDNRGSRHGRSKITEADVVEIKNLLAEGCLTQKMIGNLFGITRESISGIKRGKSWKHIT